MPDFTPKPGEQFLTLVNGRWHHAEIRGGHPGDVFLLTQAPVMAVRDYAVQRMAALPDAVPSAEDAIRKARIEGAEAALEHADYHPVPEAFKNWDSSKKSLRRHLAEAIVAEIEKGDL
ncbi:hypothetical protein KGP36_02460 [Patescibacteria group bacterium]|nr:hypothetical protein [Patescibacteria group bacterium]